jgi:hypothetical protein
MAEHKESKPLSYVMADALAGAGNESEITLTFMKKWFCSASPEH